MKKLWKYMRDYRREGILAPLFKLLEASLELLVPLVMAQIIDTGIANGDRGFILSRCGILAALAAVGLVCSITAQYFAAKASVGFAAKLRSTLFKHIQSLSYSKLDTQGTGTLIARITGDINQVQSGMNLALRLLLRSPFVVFGAMIMAFTIDVKAALVFVVTIPLLSIVVFGIMLWSIPMYKKVQARLDKVLGITRENLSGVRVIRAFCKEDEERREFGERNAALTKLQLMVGRVSAAMNPATYIMINLGIAVLIYVGALRVDSGILTQGQVVALYNYMSQILVELVKLASLIITITKALACAGRVSAALDVESDMHGADTMPREIDTDEEVRFENVEFGYATGGEPALSGISFSVKKGETMGIIGGTGSGKSSLVSLIPRFYDATGGHVYIKGNDVKDYPLGALREMVGMVPQKAVLFKGTIRENLRWGSADATEEEMERALSDAQALEIVKAKPEGLDSPVAQNGKNLSGGQRQRLTIARALIKKPEILILDDSASALDYATDLALRRSLAALSYKPTVFIVSQRASSILHADKIAVLDEGKMVGLGTHDELMQTCPVYREIYYSQYEQEVKRDA
ncbi:MAG: ABC transporter ATP-binding protein [Eubacteriales bacterium]|nr:ABC transporter ATP-binding protein [Eubacteriales bacterium]MCI6942847.1 ABC transporter ATP-binding protein/permease [Christensenellaceae bacterium]